jgi:hypothetical protein
MKNTYVISKEDIKSGYVVKLRNGELYMVQRVGKNFTKVLANGNDWMYMSSFDDKLHGRLYANNKPVSFDKSHDIVEVYGLVQQTMHYHLASIITTVGRECIWKRKQAVKLTVDEISEMLGYEVEIVGSNT